MTTSIEQGAGATGQGGENDANDVGEVDQRSPSESGSKTLMERVQARVRNDPATDYREDIVRSIFGEVGTPVEGERREVGFPEIRQIQSRLNHRAVRAGGYCNAHVTIRKGTDSSIGVGWVGASTLFALVKSQSNADKLAIKTAVEPMYQYVVQAANQAVPREGSAVRYPYAPLLTAHVVCGFDLHLKTRLVCWALRKRETERETSSCGVLYIESSWSTVGCMYVAIRSPAGERYIPQIQ